MNPAPEKTPPDPFAKALPDPSEGKHSQANAMLTEAMLTAAVQIAKVVSARALLVFAEAVDNPPLLRKQLAPPTRLILITRGPADVERATLPDVTQLGVPRFDLSRMDQIKMATLLALSHGLLKYGDVFVFLTGAAGKEIDTLVSMEVGQEHELFQSLDQPRLTEHIRRLVFERALTLVLELANEGREGKPVGALMVIGDHRAVMPLCQEQRINPFRGYAEKDRNILDDSIAKAVKEFAKLDGAFIVKGNGVIHSAGTILRPGPVECEVPRGLGARHAAAAAITAATKCVALTVSESDGTVRVWRRGRMITEIERAALVRAAKP